MNQILFSLTGEYSHIYKHEQYGSGRVVLPLKSEKLSKNFFKQTTLHRRRQVVDEDVFF